MIQSPGFFYYSASLGIDISELKITYLPKGEAIVCDYGRSAIFLSTRTPYKTSGLDLSSCFKKLIVIDP